MTNSLYQFPDDIRNEFSIDENGQVWASARATARLAGVSVSALTEPNGLLLKIKNSLNSVSNKNLSECLKPFAGFNYWTQKKILHDLVIAIVKYYYMNGKFSDEGLSLIKMSAPHEKIKKKYHKPRALVNTELYYLKKLHKQLGGVIEVPTLAGRIDLLTTAQIIEIKEIKGWKGAIGQILVYSYYYPSHEKRIHLFGETQEVFLDEVQKHTDKFNIVLTWEQ